MHPDTIRESVCDTLNGGVRFGFIQKKNGRYFSAQLDDFDYVECENRQTGSDNNKGASGKQEVGDEEAINEWMNKDAMKRVSSRQMGKRSKSRSKRTMSRSKARSASRGSSRRRR